MTSPKVTAPKAATPSATANAFNKEYATSVATGIMTASANADAYFLDSPEIGTASMLWLLSNDMGRLATAGIPPGQDPATYLATLTTLGQFYANAASQISASIPQAAATYTVARGHTQELLKILNGATGASNHLPDWKFM